MPLPRFLKPKFKEEVLFGFSPANITKNITIKKDADETKGIIEFYGAQQYSEESGDLVYYVIASLSIDVTGVFKSKDDLKDPISEYYSALPKDHTFGSVKLSLSEESLKKPFVSERGVESGKIFAVDIYKATLAEDKTGFSPISSSALRVFAALMNATALKKIGVQSSSGTCYRCKINGTDKVLKITKTSAETALTELAGNELVAQISGKDTRISISDVKVLHFMDQHWKNHFPLIVMNDAGQNTLQGMETLSPVLRKLPDPKSPTASPVLRPKSPPASSPVQDVSYIDYPNLKKWLGSVCEGIQSLHRKGIVHLDIKPENIGCNLPTSSSSSAPPDFKTPNMRDSAKGLENARDIAPLFDFGTASLSRSAELGKGSTDVEQFVEELRSSKVLNADKLGDFFFELAMRCIRGTQMYMAPEIKTFSSKLTGMFNPAKINTIVDVLLKTEAKSTDTEDEGLKAKQEEAYGHLKTLLTIGRKADIYSLGASIVQILCRAYHVGNVDSYDEKALEKVLAKIGKDKLPRIDADLLDLLRNMLESDPAKRYNIDQVMKHRFLNS